MKCYQILVTGKVQKVGFRYYTRKNALSLALSGVVGNQPDGSVRILAEGSVESLEAFVDWCRRGPELADVTGLQITEQEPQGFQGFEIIS